MSLVTSAATDIDYRLSAQLLRARIVWPVSTSPIENGAVYIRDGLIEDVGSWAGLSRRWAGLPIEDLGEVALMPGLVNAHCHLDYTGMAGMIPPPSSSSNFPDWIKSILSLKAHWSYTEYAASWLKGAKQLLDSGCTTVLDIEAVPELLPDAWNSTPLRVISFLEMTGVRSAAQPERILDEVEKHKARLSEDDLHFATLSPHALYSTPPELLRRVAVKMRAENALIAIHLSESQAEFDMYRNACGPLYDWLKSQRPMDDCGGFSPVQRAHQLGLLTENLLAIHCNYLAPGDAELLAQTHVTVVHCPRSHAYFKHAPFPYEQLQAAGVNVVIATDSLASVLTERGREPTLDLWAEVSAFAKVHPSTRPEEIIKMATLNSERFANGTIGALEKNRCADLIAIRFNGQLSQVSEALVQGEQDVQFSWIHGQTVN